MKIISRNQAKCNGEKRYFTGVACKNGHVSERFTKDGKCVECNRIACKLRYDKKVKSDPDRLARSVADAKRKHAAKIKREISALKRISRNVENAAFYAAIKKGESRYQTNRPCPKGHRSERYIPARTCCECSKEWIRSEDRKRYDKRYSKENREKISRRTKKYNLANKERIRKSAKAWASKNKDRVRAIKHNYKARRRAIESDGVSSAELAKWVSGQVKQCYWCDKLCDDAYHIDHYKPLAGGGKHEIDNLVIACPTCNIRKNAKDPYEFAQEVGRLF